VTTTPAAAKKVGAAGATLTEEEAQAANEALAKIEKFMQKNSKVEEIEIASAPDVVREDIDKFLGSDFEKYLRVSG
jgi:molecular chaperone DnaK (HSP70)